MILDTTTKSLELILGAAATTNAMPVVVDYVDMTTTTTLSGSSDTQSNGTTVVTILAAPAASTQRKVNSISVYNADTVSSTVTIRLNNNTTLRNLISVTLQVGDTIGFTDVNGWYLLDSNGNLKSVQAASATAIAAAIHGATNKTTPIGADEVGIWDSVSGLLNRVSFMNMLNWFAAKAGSITQAFSTATLTVVGLLDISNAASGQIKFPATQNPSADANTLDDYEEGTFTPILVSSGGGTPTYTANYGYYTKIGNRVLFNLQIVLASRGTLAAGNLSITTLPFQTSSSIGSGPAYLAQYDSFASSVATAPGAYSVATSTSILPTRFAAGALTILTFADLTDTSSFRISGQYFV